MMGRMSLKQDGLGNERQSGCAAKEAFFFVVVAIVKEERGLRMRSIRSD